MTSSSKAIASPAATECFTWCFRSGNAPMQATMRGFIAARLLSSTPGIWKWQSDAQIASRLPLSIAFQAALHMGCNDNGSVMLEENVVSAAGSTFAMTIDEVERHIRAAGFQPVRRNMRYDRVAGALTVGRGNEIRLA